MARQVAVPTCEYCPLRSHNALRTLEQGEATALDEVKGCYFYRRGEIIFREGSYPAGIYCVHQGAVKLYRSDALGNLVIVRLAKQGDLLGYRALLSNEHYTATAEALEDCIVCFIPRPTFFEVLRRNAGLMAAITELLARDLRTAESRLASLAQKTVPQRLAEILLYLRELFGEDESGALKTSMTRRELAELVGTAPETVIRLLSDFQRKGLVSVDHRHIRVLDPVGLAHVAELYD
ncbi:MAG: Crp/Fnr family transcriptional regulator [Candidatus Kapabacteria bacterium]|nr:Crp/Fnr family transcriptional regulator [Candidatus Kapabacteria bacterium]MDW8012633.1 Crp/Fnr family transcriptional regulator [Bacteroidota bacterium]